MTASFTSKLELEYIDGHNWLLTAGFDYASDVEGLNEEGGIIHVPKDFITDFASIPRGLWNLFPPTGKYGKAAVIHDFLYRMTDYDRDICDKVLLEGMEVLGVNWATRHIVYRAVRIFGGFARQQANQAGEDKAE